MKESINWRLILKITLLIVFIIGVLVVWRFFSAQVGALLAGIGGLFGFGGKAVTRKVKKRAKIKADKIASDGPDAITADINVHLNKLG